jgi:RimJ/RimL family protein N-acetyltransferase
VIETERLILRRWQPADREPFFAINSEPEVAYWSGGSVTRERSDAMIDRAEASFNERGFGRFAIERKKDRTLFGFAGIMTVRPDHPFTGVEIGWRLTKSAWGRGYATEAARAALADGFRRIGFSEVLAYTTQTNIRSRRVMEKIGMVYDAARDFDHPQLAPDHPLLRHVLYAKRASND